MNPRAVIVLSFIIVLTACKQHKTDAQSHPITSQASAAASDISARPLDSRTTPEVQPDLVHCKALGKRGRITLGNLRDELIKLVSDGDHVYVLTYHRDLARITLSRIRRDGTPPEVIGRHTAHGEPKGFTLSTDAAYFTRNKTLYRLSQKSGETEELAKGFSNGITAQASYVYGIDCQTKKEYAYLLRIASTGGTVESLVAIDRIKPNQKYGISPPCEYRSLAADESAVYIASWNSRSVLRVSLSDKTVSELSTKKTYPVNLHIEGEYVYFQAVGGLYRVSKAAADTTVRITELGSSPFTFVAYSAQGAYIHESVPYAVEEWTYALPWSTNEPEKIEHYKLKRPEDVIWGVGISDIVVDDECVYTARQFENYVELYARDHT